MTIGITTQETEMTIGMTAKPRIIAASTRIIAASNRMPDLAADLAEEIGRAHVLAKGRFPEHIVCMNSEVEFRDDATGKIQTVRLVYPEEADIAKGKISVLTPVGTALIGLPEGQSIKWESPSGELRQLTVLAVREYGTVGELQAC
jgi:regulator of nucleoside diphosphate kinase